IKNQKFIIPTPTAVQLIVQAVHDPEDPLQNQITIDVDNYSTFSDSVSEVYTSDEQPSDEQRLITNQIAKVQTKPIQQPVATNSTNSLQLKTCSNKEQCQTQTITNVLPCNNNQKYKNLKKILTAIILLSILALFWYHQKTNNAIISNLIETINVEIFEKYNLWKNAKFFETENNALKVENYALKYELSNLKTRYTDLEKDITNLKEKYIASNERKIILESQETEFKYTIKNLKDTIKDFEATINDLKNNEINLKEQYKELLRKLTLLKNKNEESENRKKQLENKINKIIEDRDQLINTINKLRKKGNELKNKYEKEKQEIQNKLDELEAERINKIVKNSKRGYN
ncbi:43275_t:CDS:2, partial [Gigaspora margarita]